jgi:hypothetical protein
MAKVTFRYSETTPEERKKALRALAKQVNVEESLEELIREAKKYEKKFGMSTLEFYAKYRRGEMGDSKAVMEWAGAYEEYTYLMQRYRRAVARSR